MAGSLNKVMLIGNVGRDPEIRYGQTGDPIATFSVATSETWKDKQTGERRERTEWHRVVIFNKHLAEIVERYIRKGSSVYIEGQLQTRKWQGQDGQDRYTTEVVLSGFSGTLTMLGKRGDNQGGNGGYGSDSGSYGHSSGDSGGSSGGSSPVGGGYDDFDDEIPFITGLDAEDTLLRRRGPRL